jgi:hypothetical protein
MVPYNASLPRVVPTKMSFWFQEEVPLALGIWDAKVKEKAKIPFLS